MDPNGYGASSTYTMGMIWKSVMIMEKGEWKKVKSVTKSVEMFLEWPKSVFGETFTMYL